MAKEQRALADEMTRPSQRIMVLSPGELTEVSATPPSLSSAEQRLAHPPPTCHWPSSAYLLWGRLLVLATLSPHSLKGYAMNWATRCALHRPPLAFLEETPLLLS